MQVVPGHIFPPVQGEADEFLKSRPKLSSQEQSAFNELLAGGHSYITSEELENFYRFAKREAEYVGDAEVNLVDNKYRYCTDFCDRAEKRLSSPYAGAALLELPTALFWLPRLNERKEDLFVDLLEAFLSNAPFFEFNSQIADHLLKAASYTRLE